MAYAAKGRIEVPFSAKLAMTSLREAVRHSKLVTQQHASDWGIEVLTRTTMRSWGEKIRFTVQEIDQRNALIEHGNTNLLGTAAPNKDYRTAVEMIQHDLQLTLLEAFLTVEAKGASFAYLGTMVGGYNTDIPVGRAVVFAPGQTGVYIGTGETLYSFGTRDLVSVVAGGPGSVTSGGGFIGGGLGLDGAVAGMLAASVLNSLTTHTSVNTLIHISTTAVHNREYLIHTSAATPEQLKVNMSGLHNAIALAQTAVTSEIARGTASVADDLQAISQLHAAGSLSDEEFAKAKQRILG